jgi:uncharacterized OsmC-like protein
MSDKIAESLKGAMEYVSTHTEEARYTDSPASARLTTHLRVDVDGPGGASLMTDMPESVGGDDAAPSPGWIMRAAMASCEVTLIAMRAAVEGVSLSELEVIVDSESDDRGILGLDDSIPAGPLSARVRVSASAEGTSPEQLRSIIEWAHEHCPVIDTVARAIPITLEIKES